MSQMRYLDKVATLELGIDRCVGCGLCTQVCPHGVLEMTLGKAAILDRDLCMECGACARNCPVEAIAVKAGVGCASAIIYGWLTGKEPSCDCGGAC